jgi:putative CocE/NonD family hydrolase
MPPLRPHSLSSSAPSKTMPSRPTAMPRARAREDWCHVDDGEDTHPHISVESNMVPLRDGVLLATDVYLPAHGTYPSLVPDYSPRPCLLHRTPYNKDKSARTERCLLPDGTLSEPIDSLHTAERFAKRGYVVVVQDVRGRYSSQGVFSKYTREAVDGADTLAWILAQPWCSGEVGTFGLSYCAHVQVCVCMHMRGVHALLPEP